MLVPVLLMLSSGCVSQGARPEAASTPDAAAPGPAPEASSYTACGCGCCPGVEPHIQCLGGESLQSVIARDKQAAASPDCPMAGCSLPVKYQACDGS
ncbi:hypothetical protein D7V93_08205 [Corallococcus llansteffanensis]|uniref:Uncharacterized protein n=2 Tax=Corallococcus llansteffanensis TaxID=2316731 RepID=A0A3A8QG48_9BACT|nr:hypothetical protein D7V93_08205 [Corallococcus llansteffanensis]